MYKKILACALMLALLLTIPVYASSDAEMIGTYSDKFELTVHGDDLFDIPIMNPGDVWNSDLEIKNHTGEKMEVKLSEVVNDIQDAMMFDVLEVTILLNGEEFYKGPYNEVPMSQWISVENGEKVVVSVTLKFPGECGNEYQGKILDSTWKFEARLPDGAPPVEDKPEDPVPTGVIRGAYICGMICIGAFIFFILLGKKKDDDEKAKTRRR